MKRMVRMGKYTTRSGDCRAVPTFCPITPNVLLDPKYRSFRTHDYLTPQRLANHPPASGFVYDGSRTMATRSEWDRPWLWTCRRVPP
jgi:hypothetical protein